MGVGGNREDYLYLSKIVVLLKANFYFLSLQ